MAREIITSEKVRQPAVPLSLAVKSGGFVFVAGTAPFDKDGSVVKDDFEAQMHQVMENMKNVLETAGSSLSKVLKTTVILERKSDFPAMNEIYRTYFTEGSWPARTTIEAPFTGADFLLEIECVAET